MFGVKPSEIPVECDPMIDTYEKFKKLWFLDLISDEKRKILVYDGPAASNQLVVTAGDRLSNSGNLGRIDTEILTDVMDGFDHPARGMIIKGDLTLMSDFKLKEKVSKIQISEYEKINQIRGRRYTFKDSIFEDMGVIAQEVEVLFPELVSHSNEGKKVDYIALIPILLEKVKSNQRRIENLKSRIKDLI